MAMGIFRKMEVTMEVLLGKSSMNKRFPAGSMFD
jgi:hypothetical protein